MGTEKKPPQSAKKLLKRYAKGERDFASAKLDFASLYEAKLRRVDLSGAQINSSDLRYADLKRANLSKASLSATDLSFAKLIGAHLRRTHLGGADVSCVNFTRANLSRANLSGANLSEAVLVDANLTGADLGFANLDGANLTGCLLNEIRLDSTVLTSIDLSPLCQAGAVVHAGPCRIDYQSVLLSLHAHNLKTFLQRTGMPEVFVEYMVECARAMDGSLIKKLLQSIFLAYGGSDEPLARHLYEDLSRNGVTTFFHAEHAKVGQRRGRVVREGVESYDRILLLCSAGALGDADVLYVIEETLERERRDGGVEYLIPIELDDCLRVEGAVLRKDLVRLLRDRVCGDFRGAQEDEEVFAAGLRRLIAALRPLDVALWRPPGASKPEP